MYVLQGEKVTSNAFLSPRWGGVMIYNPKDQESEVKVDMHKVMEVFVSQIRLLLNIDGQVGQGSKPVVGQG